MHALAANLLYALAWILGRLPWPLRRTLADGFARFWIARDGRESRITRRNLELIAPDQPATEREAMHAAILRTSARQAIETLRIWTRPSTDSLRDIVQVHGEALFDAALADPRGLVVAAPHMGNWELLNRWLAEKTELAILYRAPESRIGEAFLRKVRADQAGRVQQVRAEAAGVRTLLKRLQAGGVVGILPDQQPKLGDGAFAPFFGRQALTMTLMSRLAARSGAQLLFAWCERLPGDGPPRFTLHIEPGDPAVAAADPQVAAAALNAQVEAIARRDLSQYQWTYKRYTLRPPESGEENPYYPDCY